MLTRSFHIARHEVETLGISTDEAILKYSEWMTEKEVNIIKNMEVKAMKKAVRKTIGNGNNARLVNIKSYEYGKGIKVKNISRKAPKVSDFKVFKIFCDNYTTGGYLDTMIKEYTVFENSDTVILTTIITDGETSRIYDRQTMSKAEARENYRQAMKTWFKKESKELKATDSKASTKKPSKKPSKKSTQVENKETAKKASTKKASKKASRGTTKQTAKAKTAKTKSTKADSNKEFKLVRGMDSSKETYTFEMETETRMLVIGTSVRNDGVNIVDYAEVLHISDARQMYRSLLNKGFKRVA